MFHHCMSNVLLLWKDIVFVTHFFLLIFFFFFCYILILFVNNKQNISILLQFNPLCDKKTVHVRKSVDLFSSVSF